MINKPIETYKDLVRAKNTYDFARNYPDMDNGTLNFIFDFTETIGAKVIGNKDKIMFYVNAKLVKTVDMKMDSNYSFINRRTDPSRRRACRHNSHNNQNLRHGSCNKRTADPPYN